LPGQGGASPALNSDWLCRSGPIRQPRRELFRSSGAVPLVKHEFFRVNDTLCSTREIYVVPDEAAGRALAVNLQVRQARESGEDWPEDPMDAAKAYLEQTECR
jgi:hypothetical protein